MNLTFLTKYTQGAVKVKSKFTTLIYTENIWGKKKQQHKNCLPNHYLPHHNNFHKLLDIAEELQALHHMQVYINKATLKKYPTKKPTTTTTKTLYLVIGFLELLFQWCWFVLLASQAAGQPITRRLPFLYFLLLFQGGFLQVLIGSVQHLSGGWSHDWIIKSHEWSHDNKRDGISAQNKNIMACILFMYTWYEIDNNRLFYEY